MTRAYKNYYRFFAWLFKFLYRIEVVGAENIPESDGFLVCSNHFSATDPIKVAYAFRGHQIHFMAKKELFKIPLFNSLIRVMGAFPVDRSRADVGAVKYMLKLLENGKSAGMFPQGTRHPGKDPRTTSVKTGVGMIAARTGATVVPVFIEQKDYKHRNFRPSVITIGKPITPEELNYQHGVPGEYNRMSQLVFDRICAIGEENGYLK